MSVRLAICRYELLSGTTVKGRTTVSVSWSHQLPLHLHYAADGVGAGLNYQHGRRWKWSSDSQWPTSGCNCLLASCCVETHDASTADGGIGSVKSTTNAPDEYTADTPAAEVTRNTTTHTTKH